MAARKVDSLALAQDLASGQLTYAQIADKHGICESYVGQLARGEKGAEVKVLVDRILDGYAAQARALGKRLAVVAMGRLGALVGSDSAVPPDVQRKAAVDILTFTLGDPSKAEVNISQRVTGGVGSLTGLSDPTKAAVLRELGGPEFDDDGPADDPT